ncbi:MAG TPA: hypothetical protein EYP63_08970 [Desulfotomaculum sp.]|nr:hypothetical protein [Desulfotomaculum sp.]
MTSRSFIRSKASGMTAAPVPARGLQAPFHSDTDAGLLVSDKAVREFFVADLDMQPEMAERQLARMIDLLILHRRKER